MSAVQPLQLRAVPLDESHDAAVSAAIERLREFGPDVYPVLCNCVALMCAFERGLTAAEHSAELVATRLAAEVNAQKGGSA